MLHSDELGSTFLWSLPEWEWSPEWLDTIKRPISGRWPTLCHSKGRDWIDLIQGFYRTRDIWIHWVPDRWRQWYDYARSDHLLKTRTKPHETLVVVTLVGSVRSDVCSVPFSLLKAIAFLQSQTVLEPRKTAVFLKAFPLVGVMCNIHIESKYSPFHVYIHFRYIFFCLSSSLLWAWV